MRPPLVSVVTTVYDRTACLDRCLRAMRHQQFDSWEQIVVSDHPPDDALDAIRRLVETAGSRVRHLDTGTRLNDWGMTPAHLGLMAAQGEYVCFLSDDNAFLPDHLGPLVAILERDRRLGFVYSSCLYAGRTELRTCPPFPARIDLGQPVFRTALLREIFPAGFPFREFAWDWRLVKTLLDRKVLWKHRDVTTFVFRLAAYPSIMERLA